MRRRFNQSERLALYLAADGKCQICGDELGKGWHADHVLAYVEDGVTDVINGQALCPTCNLKKGASMRDKPNLILRQWQEEEQDKFEKHQGKWFVLVATPGAGKTPAMLNNAYYVLRDGQANFLVVVVPSETLKYQWKERARTLFGLHLKASFDGWVTEEYDGIVVTYQQLSGSLGAHQVRALHRGRKIFTIFDEPHHMAAGLRWGDSATSALMPSIGGVLGTGTPFRSDDYVIPFVEYTPGDKELIAHYEYLYADGLIDQVVRALYFSKTDTEATWYSYTDEIVTASFYDEVNERQMGERLNATISPNSDFTQMVLKQSYAELMRIRQTEQDNAKMLVICKGLNHATDVAETFQRVNGFMPVVVTSDTEHGGKDEIENFRLSIDPVIIAVDMVSEGIDIPPLRALVYLTNKTAPLYFMQAIGRVVRVERGLELANGYVYLPSDPRLLAMAHTIKERRNHVLSVIDRDMEPRDKKENGDVVTERLFEPISASGINDGGIYDAEDYSNSELLEAGAWVQANRLRIPVEEAARILRIIRHTASDGDGLESQTYETDPETLQKNLRKTAARHAYNLSAKRGCDVKSIHAEWKHDHGGQWQARESIEGLKRKIKWLKSELVQYTGVYDGNE